MRNARLLALMFALVLTAAACGGSAEEQILEQILESSGEDISNLDIDTGSGDFSMTVEGEDGEEINITSGDDDGAFSMTVEGEDGEVITFGGGEVPDGIKTPIPDGGSVTQSYSSESDRSVSVQYDSARFDELVTTYDGVFASGDVSRSESSYSTEDGTIRTVSWYSNDNDINVSVADCYSLTTGELGNACVTIYEFDS